MDAECGNPGLPATTPERWRKIESVLDGALEQAAELRLAWVAEACGSDADLRHEVETLLAGDERIERFLESPALGSAEPPQPLAPQLASGEQLGPYRIVALLGAGGMGEVYSATDTRLDRSVAIKLLPARFARDAQALERFQREARAASALNHPNICTLHDIGARGGQPFLVLELLEGQTLKDRLAAGPLPIPEVIQLGVQIAGALEAAHAKGIVHRDVKPANIFVTQRGEAKVLDFGLAKLVSGPVRPQEARTTSAAPISTEATISVPGWAMGTVSYMSPEQARGEPVDERTDIFSLGATLYEMATGRRPFQGSTLAETLEAIQTRHPASPRELKSSVSARLERVILKALQKERTARFQKAAELRADLERLRPAPQRVATLLAAALLLVLAATLAVARFGWFTTPPSIIELTARQVTASPSEDPVLRASISPDGQFIAYPDLTGIHVRRIATGETHSIPPPENACFR
jgi:serine/threonine protein kinase